MHAKTAGKKSKKEILEDAEELLKELRFENPQRVLKSYPFELSGGMCQRVAIALAIMNQPSDQCAGCRLTGYDDRDAARTAEKDRSFDSAGDT